MEELNWFRPKLAISPPLSVSFSSLICFTVLYVSATSLNKSAMLQIRFANFLKFANLSLPCKGGSRRVDTETKFISEKYEKNGRVKSWGREARERRDYRLLSRASPPPPPLSFLSRHARRTKRKRDYSQSRRT